MPGADVQWPFTLVRFPTLFPGQMGVPGTDNITGERLHCTGKVLYVDPNFPGADDRRDGTDPTAPLASVQAAVNMTTDYAGDVIVVMQNASWDWAGGLVYTVGIAEEVTLDRAGVRLVGLSPGGLGVPWSPASDGGICLTITAMDCLVEGFAFFEGAYNGANGIYAEWGWGLLGENLVVQNCFFDSSIDIAIQLEYTWYCAIRRCKFERCDEYGIYVDPLGSGIAYTVICDNWFDDCGTSALYLPGATRCDIHHNHIFSSNAQSGAVATDEGITTEDGARNLVHHNVLSCLLPVPANGDYDDFCTPDIAGGVGYTDAWIENYCMDGPTVRAPN